MSNFEPGYRVFLAISPPNEALAEIREVKRKFKKHARNFRFVAIDQMHITLQFLGNNVTETTLESMIPHLVSIARDTSPFSTSLEKLNFGFPGQNIAKVLFMDTVESTEMMKLVDDVHAVTKSMKYTDVNKKKDHAKLVNHLTLGRVKGDVSRSFTREILEFIKTIDFQPITFEVKKFQLIKSEFKNNTKSYLPLHEFELQK